MVHTQSLIAQVQRGQQEALRLSKEMASREQELAAQLLAAQTYISELKLTFAAHERKFDTSLNDLQQKSLQLEQALRESEQQFASKSDELLAVTTSKLWRVWAPLRWVLRIRT